MSLLDFLFKIYSPERLKHPQQDYLELLTETFLLYPVGQALHSKYHFPCHKRESQW